ncbi:3-oxoacyl-[acyl-carrier-protein] reductase [Mycolicibacterium setense]|uniref:3-oxoacyl-ACP reductase FabG n=1 Tax=Mycolicibacterium setense TaxID=431269 RepID=UPI0007EB2E96|nr:3-oxoacyl-ACP reductase FabG [Mycolicibacterium setense]OBB14648.1 3-oxoacyl-[acyl-carrier-protein] reductase [Mycolicibacterium setense]
MTGEFTGKHGVITGAAQGIGYAIAEHLVTNGATVVVADLDDSAATAAAEKLNRVGPGSARGVGCDVTNEEDVASAATACQDTAGRIDFWVNNAGITRDLSLRNMTLADFRAVIDVHLVGAWLGIRAAAAQMREQGSGSIVNISSISGKVGNPGQTNYSAAKAGLVGMTKAAAKELGRYGIRVNAVAPGLTRTSMIEAMKPGLVEARVAEIPLGRVGEPAEVAEAVSFLLSQRSSYMTGAVLQISGGRHM